MSRRNVKIFDNSGKRSVFWVTRDQSQDMLERGILRRDVDHANKLLLAQPANSVNEKRGMFQSLHPGTAKAVVPRRNEGRGRGTLLRGGRGGRFEDALLARSCGRANGETTIAIESWGITRGSR